MHTKEQKILKLSMILLSLALVIVYIVRYQVKGNEFKTTINTQNSGSGIQILSKSGDSISESVSLVDIATGGVEKTGNIAMMTGIKTNITGNIISGTKITTGTMKATTDIKLLSGTSIYYGPIAITEKLGIKYQYALTDTSGIWYIYLGAPSYDFASIARALKGNIYTMATEKELLENKLFGNKVVYINLPEYKDNQVVMLVYMNNGIRLIQVEYNLYHKSKAYIKSLFID